MSGFKKRVVVAGLLAACLGVGTASFLRAQATPATQPAADQPLASINGHEIDNKKFNELLMNVAGLRMFEEVLDWTLVEQACGQAGIPTDGDSFKKLWGAEYDRELASIPNVPADATKEDRAKILAQLLSRQGHTEIEFQMGLQKQAGLRALAQGHVDVSDDEVKQQFDAEYGEQVEVRILTVKSLTDAAKVRDAIEKDKKDPTQVAQDMNIPIQPLRISKNANADQIKDIKDIAFQLKEKQLSASIPLNNLNFLVYLDKKVPAQTDVKFDSVKDKVRKEVFAAKENAWMQNHLSYLRQNARVEVNDPILKQQFQAIAAQMKAQQAAATAPATAPAK